MSTSATVASSSLALQTYEPPVRDRRVHLDDLSGVLELVILVAAVYALRSLRRRELSLAHFSHTLFMSTFLFIGGHFIEEHMLGVRKLEGLLKFGFQALSEDYSTPPRSGIVNIFRGIWELSGVFVGCSGLLYSRLWKCGHPECCPSCIASHSSISAGQGLAGNGCGPVHFKCRLLRIRFYLPIFLTWWIFIIVIIGGRFNSLLGGSAIRPANDAYYFLAVLRSSPFIGLATIGATLSVWIMAELLEAEGKPQVNDIFRSLAMEMENDDIIRSLLGQQLERQDNLSKGPSSTCHKTPIHGSSYVSQKQDISSGSFFVEEANRVSSPPPPASFPDPANTPSWSVPTPNYQAPPASFTQTLQSRSPPGSMNTFQNGAGNGLSQSNSSGNLNADFEVRAAQAEAEAFAWARQQSTQAPNSNQSNWSSIDKETSRQIRSPTSTSALDQPVTGGGILTRGRLPPASAPQRAIQRSPSAGHRSMSPSARQRSMSPSTRVAIPANLRKFNRGGGDVSHLISSDSESDDDDEDRKAHAAMVGLYEDLGGNSSNRNSLSHKNGAWPASTSSSDSSSPQIQPLSAPKGVLLNRTNSGNILTGSPKLSNSSNSLEELQPLSSPKVSSSSITNSQNSFPDTPGNISLTSMNSNRNQMNSSSYSPATKKAAMQAASAALQQGGGLLSPKPSSNRSVDMDPTSPISPVNLASRGNFDSSPTSRGNFDSSPTSSQRGRPETRSNQTSGFSDRPVSLTRSNADSSDSDDSDSESDVSSSDEAIRKNLNQVPSSNLKKSIGNNENPKSLTVHFEHKPPPLNPNDHRQSSSGISDFSKNSENPEIVSQRTDRSSSIDSIQSGGSGDSPSSVGNLAKDGWKRFVDDSSGAAYWFNENSGESSWTKPIPSQG